MLRAVKVALAHPSPGSQVQRVKNKWKVTLKDGLVSVNGKEYLFAKCTGYVVLTHEPRSSDVEPLLGAPVASLSGDARYDDRCSWARFGLGLFLCRCTTELALVNDEKCRVCTRVVSTRDFVPHSRYRNTRQPATAAGRQRPA